MVSSGSAIASYQSLPHGPLQHGGDAAGGDLQAGTGRQVVGQQRAAQRLGGPHRPVRGQLPVHQRGGELAVAADELLAALVRAAGLVVEPGGGAERLPVGGGQRQRVAGAEAELGGDLAEARADGGVGGQVGDQQ